MKIVVLDGFALNPGDLSWRKIEEIGELAVYDHTTGERIVERARGAEIILTNKTALDAAVLNELEDLKYIGVLATGYNVIDVYEASKKGITVTNIPTYGTYSVAQHTFALILEICNHVQRHNDTVIEGRWARSRDYSYWDYPMIELASKTLGIIGFGNIGSKVNEIATAFGMNVISYSKSIGYTPGNKNFRWVALDELLERSDFISIHCPLTPETQGLVNMSFLRRMKSSAFLINTSRGRIIVENDLAEALNNGIIAGAGLDVLSVEPPEINNPLIKAKNCIVTPHIAWATVEARSRLMDIAAENLKAYLSGNPVNIVNPVIRA